MFVVFRPLADVFDSKAMRGTDSTNPMIGKRSSRRLSAGAIARTFLRSRRVPRLVRIPDIESDTRPQYSSPARMSPPPVHTGQSDPIMSRSGPKHSKAMSR